MVSQAELRRATPSSQISRQKISRVNEQIEIDNLRKIAEYERQQAEYDKNIAEYEKQKAAYDSQAREAQLWEQAQKLVFKGKGYAAKGDPELWAKVKAIEEQGSNAQKYAVMKAGVSSPTQLVQPQLSPPISQQQNLAYKNVFTGEIIQQSIAPEIAAKRGLTPIVVDIKGVEIPNKVANIEYPEQFKEPERVKFEKPSRVGETYSSQFGSYYKPGSPSGQGTIILTGITEKEQQKIEATQEKVSNFFGKVASVEASIVPSKTLDRVVYLPDEASKEKYKKLIEESKYGVFNIFNLGAGYKLSEFGRAQEKVLAADIEKAEAYNKLATKYGQDFESFEYGETVNTKQLFDRIERGSFGKSRFQTGWDVLKSGAEVYEAEGKKVGIPGGYISPGAARFALKLGTTAYDVEKVVLGFQLAGAKLGGGFKITGTANQMNWLAGAQASQNILIGTSLATVSMAKELKRTGDVNYAIAAGVGTGIGFFGSVYSRQIVESVPKTFKAIDARIKEMPPISQSKKAVFGSEQSTYQEQVVEVEYNGQRVKMKLSDARRLGLKVLNKGVTVGQVREFLATGSNKYASQAERLTKLLETAKTPELKLKVIKEARNIFGDNFVKEYLTQEGYLIQSSQGEKIIELSSPSKNLFISKSNQFMSPIVLDISSTKSKQVTKQFNPLAVGETSWVGTMQESESEQTPKQLLNFKQDSLQTPAQVTLQKPAQDTLQSPAQDSLQVPRQTTVQIPIQKLISRTVPGRPITPIGLFTLGTSGFGKKQKAFGAKEDTFEAVAFRFGKEVSVKKGSKQEASYALDKFLKGTLSASGFLKEVKSGKKIKAEETGLLRGFDYRKSKVSPYIVVEKKSKRLRRGSTGKEIQLFRPGKKSKRYL